ncbi:MAG: ATP synthase subunit I [Gammaproteobacteria bacterium]
MNEALHLAPAAAAGLLLGAVFFGGLWWTVRFCLGRERPAFWFVGSMVLRLGLALAGFYFVGREDWRQLMACLLGFVTARFAVVWLTRARPESRMPSTQEARRAPQP